MGTAADKAAEKAAKEAAKEAKKAAKADAKAAKKMSKTGVSAVRLSASSVMPPAPVGCLDFPAGRVFQALLTPFRM